MPHSMYAQIIGDQNGAGFNVGDIVSLIIGGPDMVVIGVCECSTVEVAWADSNGDVQVDVFPVEALIYV